jgi:hypothetical protein
MKKPELWKILDVLNTNPSEPQTTQFGSNMLAWKCSMLLALLLSWEPLSELQFHTVEKYLLDFWELTSPKLTQSPHSPERDYLDQANPAYWHKNYFDNRLDLAQEESVCRFLESRGWSHGIYDGMIWKYVKFKIVSCNGFTWVLTYDGHNQEYRHISGSHKSQAFTPETEVMNFNSYKYGEEFVCFWKWHTWQELMFFVSWNWSWCRPVSKKFSASSWIEFKEVFWQTYCFNKSTWFCKALPHIHVTEWFNKGISFYYGFSNTEKRWVFFDEQLEEFWFTHSMPTPPFTTDSMPTCVLRYTKAKKRKA